MNGFLDDVRRELVMRAASLDLSGPAGAMQEEPLSEHVVELIGLRHARVVSDQLATDLLSVLAEDLAHRLGLLPWPGALPRAATVLPRVLPRESFDSVLAVAEKVLPDNVSGRLIEPKDTIRTDVASLREIFAAEWLDADPLVVSAGGAELVCRLGRVIVAATLMRAAIETTGDPDQPITIARRYAWRWLRDPVPEPATPIHRRRTASLLQACEEQ